MPKGSHPNSIAQLKRYPKGVSGNPGGRPHKLPITDRQQIKLEDPAPAILIQQYNRQFACMKCGVSQPDGKGGFKLVGTGKEGKSHRKCKGCGGSGFHRVLADTATCADVMVWRRTLDSMMGDLAVQRDITDRGEGSPRQRVEISTPENREIVFRHVYEQLESKNKPKEIGTDGDGE